MKGESQTEVGRAEQRPPLNVRGARLARLIGCLLPLLLSGCSAIWHPYARTIEHKMEVLNRMPRSEMRPIDPRLLGQTPPPEHLVDDGDILGIYIEGGPGPDNDTLPVRFPDDRFVSPAIGYPTPVRTLTTLCKGPVVALCTMHVQVGRRMRRGNQIRRYHGTIRNCHATPGK